VNTNTRPRIAYNKRRVYLSFKVRCSNHKCRSRRTLPRHPDQYRTQPRCRFCGRRKWTVDWFRTAKAEAKTPSRRVCDCGAVHCPHRASWCENLREPVAWKAKRR
jgi:hypothetical protein